MKSHCKRGHELTEENRYRSKNGKLCGGCKACKSLWHVEYKRDRTEYFKAYRKRDYETRIKDRVKGIRQYLLSVRTQCIRCGETHPGCLDFHHREPKEKSFALVASQIGNRSWDKVKAEIAKCDILCSNCHRKLHYKQRKDES